MHKFSVIQNHLLFTKPIFMKNLQKKVQYFVVPLLFATSGVFLSCKKQHLADPGISQNVPGSASQPLPVGLTSIKIKGPSGEHDYKNLQDIPWITLKPGDVVYIPYRSEPYREKIIVSTDGLKIIGIPGPNGALPVLDGQNAASKGKEYVGCDDSSDLNERSVICVGNNHSMESKIPNWGHQPKNISIENLEIRNVRQEYQFTDNGKPRNYIKSVAAIWVAKVSDLTIKNCVIHNCACAIFVMSKNQKEPNNAGISRNITIEGNYFYDNGVVGENGIHNTYIEAINVWYKNNRYMSLIPGALGATLKDRSSNTVICYNWLESAKRVLDLVEPQESAGITTQDPGFKDTYVYGNLIYNGRNGSSKLIHYGGDTGSAFYSANYRKGTLYFYNNTFVNETNKDDHDLDEILLFELPTDDAPERADETVDCRNNIIYNAAATDGHTPSDLYLLSAKGNLALGKNWISPGYKTRLNKMHLPDLGKISVEDKIVTNKENNPGFVNCKGKDFRLISTSCVIDACGICADKIRGDNLVTKQYVPNQGIKPRFVNGRLLDLGAFEFGN